MSALLRSWARALGGDVSGNSVLAPGPGHSRRDRSLTVTLSSTAPNGFLVHSFAGDDPIICLDYVRAKLGLPAFAPQKSATGAGHGAAGHGDSGAPAEAADNGAKAAWLWGGVRKPITEDCPVWLYFRRARRYDLPIPPTLGYLPPNGKHPPALIAAFGFCKEPEPGVVEPPANVTGVHITRLTLDGRKSPEDKPKIMLGPSAGLPIVLAPANDLLAIDIVEGIETGLSVLALRGAGVWVAGAAGRMPKLIENLPPYTACLHIFAERDAAGLRFAREAARLAVARGIETHVKAFDEAAP
jgi:Toprim domain